MPPRAEAMPSRSFRSRVGGRSVLRATDRQEANEMTTVPESKATVQRYVEALEAGDEQVVRACFAEDAVWTLHGSLPISGVWEGREAILGEFLATALGYYEPGSISLEVTSVIAEGDRVVLEWTSRARTRDGAPYENFCIGVFTVADGRIRSVREYMDTLYAAETAFASAQR
jgi:uncharacterized protein (TIGR02246 family)